MLKVDLHIHTKDDPRDALAHSAEELIDYAARLNYDVLSFTLHGKVLEQDGLKDYARERNILLFSGIEKFVNRKEVLIYNVSQKDMNSIKTFDDLRSLRKERGEEILVIAPHPFYKKYTCLGEELVRNIDCFDAIEYSHLFLPTINWNLEAEEVSRKTGKPMFATSDTHSLWMFGQNYTWVDTKDKSLLGVFRAIRQGNVKIQADPYTYSRLGKLLAWTCFVHSPRKWRKIAMLQRGDKYA